MIRTNRKYLLAGIIGVLVAILIGYTFTSTTSTTHPVGTSTDTKVHVHGDFRMYINDARIRFTDKKYQSSAEKTHHVALHFHDGNDEVIHRHADSVTLTEFFTSLNITLTNDCVTMDTGTKYCANKSAALMLIVNGKRVTEVNDYIFSEEDRILLYYGDPTNPNIKDYVAGITDLSCMYSGTCPERGIPPTESCGLTCEVADLAATKSEHWLLKIQDLFSKH